MDPILEVLIAHLETIGTVAVLKVDNWELSVESGATGKPHFIIEPQDAGFDYIGRKTLSFSVSAWTNQTSGSYDIASQLCDSWNGKALYNGAGWLHRIDVVNGVEVLPPYSDRVAGAGFEAMATLKRRSH